MRRNLQQSVVAITGASRGLGAALAIRFARRGAKVALLARSGELLNGVVEQVVGLGGQAAAWPTDVRDAEAVEQTFRGILSRFGRIDILVNAAGMKCEGPIERTDPGDAMEALSVNYLGPLACCRAVIPAMRRQGAGHLINVSSVLGKRATPERGAYAASKAALNAMTESLRMELVGTGIYVTLVCPGRLAETNTARGDALVMTFDEAAERIVRCVERPRREVVLTTAGRVLCLLNSFAPAIVDRVLLCWRRRERRDETSASPAPASAERRAL